MARQRDYAAEYARRMAGARTAEEREAARGHRGEAAFERMAKGADSVRIYGNLTEQGKAFATIHKGGRTYRFKLADGKPMTEAQANAAKERWKDQIANVPDVEVNISP